MPVRKDFTAKANQQFVSRIDGQFTGTTAPQASRVLRIARRATRLPARPGPPSLCDPSGRKRGQAQPAQPQHAGTTRIFQQDCDTCFTRVFPEEQLDDGAAIVGYDAMLVAIQAIRSGASQQDNTPTALTPGAVLQAMFRINRVNPVSGAGGPISFDDQGKPIDKAVPILQFNPNGTVDATGSTEVSAQTIPRTANGGELICAPWDTSRTVEPTVSRQE